MGTVLKREILLRLTIKLPNAPQPDWQRLGGRDHFAMCWGEPAEYRDIQDDCHRD